MQSKPAPEEPEKRVKVSRAESIMSLFERAEESLRAAQIMAKNEHWAGACYWSYLASGQSFETYLIYSGGKRGEIESAGAMAQMCSELQPDFSEVIRMGKYLDRYDVTTRDLEAWPRGAVPYKWFDEEDATEAIEYAAHIVAFTRTRLSLGDDATPR